MRFKFHEKSTIRVMKGKETTHGEGNIPTYGTKIILDLGIDF